MTFQAGPIALQSEAETVLFAQDLAAILVAGDTILLAGPIGAGKTALARALIRARLENDEDVPSPTFTLVQTYDAGDIEIWHCDLYRLTQIDELIELGLDHAFETAICLIEWPDRLGSYAPHDALTLTMAAPQSMSETAHQMTVSGNKKWAQRLGGLFD
ncbi:MAG: tRNA (adenosine(37)-N6)-threonylcarbamoyltransferase complex ATPase subunit type 1 TsaE [Octadecabacter sp.]